MRTLSISFLAAAALVLGVAASTAALAHGGQYPRARVGVYIGAPVLFAPWYYAYPGPYYYHPYAYSYPYAIATPSGPTEYIEQRPASSAQGSDPYWYYCPEAKAYYPYVDKCPRGWQRVKPQPPS